MKNIAVIYGGQSSEHDVSCMSVLNVIAGLNKDKYKVHKIGITKEGKWLYVEDTEQIRDGSWRESTVTAVISPDRGKPGIWVCREDGMEILPVDVIFPVMHGKYGEDGTIQGLFEMSGIPYVGCGVLASAVSMDKLSTKIYVDQIGVKQANYVADIHKDMANIDETISRVESKLGYPVFVKPSNAGSSQGVSMANDRDELYQAITLAKEHDDRVLIEEAITGREVECAVLGGDQVEASVIGEIVVADKFYDFDDKYNSNQSRTVVDPADLSDALKAEIQKAAVEIFKAVHGFGLSRVDFFVERDTDAVIFNEINTLPGFTDISMYPMLWQAKGLDREALIDRLIDLAYER